MIGGVKKSFINICNKSNYLKTKMCAFNLNVLDNRCKSPTTLETINKKLYVILPCANLQHKVNINLNKNFICTIDGCVSYKEPSKVFSIVMKLKWVFRKFKYHGKGYKIKKITKLRKLTFRFGRSH